MHVCNNATRVSTTMLRVCVMLTRAYTMVMRSHTRVQRVYTLLSLLYTCIPRIYICTYIYTRYICINVYVARAYTRTQGMYNIAMIYDTRYNHT